MHGPAISSFYKHVSHDALSLFCASTISDVLQSKKGLYLGAFQTAVSLSSFSTHNLLQEQMKLTDLIK
jgi:hypothetical protein